MLGPLGLALDQHLEPLADERLLLAREMRCWIAMIFRCRACFTRSGTWPSISAAAVPSSLRVLEDAQPLEALLADEAEQVLEVLLGLARAARR